MWMYNNDMLRYSFSRNSNYMKYFFGLQDGLEQRHRVFHY